MDLAQAEAVLDTIRAKTAGSLRVAQAQRRGALSREIEGIRGDLVTALAHVEAALDFSEEDIAFVGRAELIALLLAMSARLTRLLETARDGRILREGATVAIVGRPNGEIESTECLDQHGPGDCDGDSGHDTRCAGRMAQYRRFPVRLLGYGWNS